jgi:hypothetical protein
VLSGNPEGIPPLRLGLNRVRADQPREITHYGGVCLHPGGQSCGGGAEAPPGE